MLALHWYLYFPVGGEALHTTSRGYIQTTTCSSLCRDTIVPQQNLVRQGAEICTGPWGEEGAELSGLASKHSHTGIYRNPQDFVTLGRAMGVVSGVLTQFPCFQSGPQREAGSQGIPRRTTGLRMLLKP